MQILIRLDDLIKIADTSIDIVKRNSKNMKYMRTGVIGAQLIDPEEVEKQLKEFLERSMKPVTTDGGPPQKITSSMRTMASFMLDKVFREREEEIKNPKLRANPKVERKEVKDSSRPLIDPNSGERGMEVPKFILDKDRIPNSGRKFILKSSSQGNLPICSSPFTPQEGSSGLEARNMVISEMDPGKSFDLNIPGLEESPRKGAIQRRQAQHESRFVDQKNVEEQELIGILEIIKHPIQDLMNAKQEMQIQLEN